MSAFPISYIEPVFRPPSEAHSLILPVTNGCSWNQCTYCEMYMQPQKKFRARKDEEIFADIERAAQRLAGVRKVFLADGDAMVLPTRRLVTILEALRRAFPELQRVSSYCLPRNIARKSVEELAELQALGLDILYVGMESGDTEVLDKVNKCETYETTVDALNKIHAAGLRSSVMVLNGLGGKRYSEQHARNSAKAINETQPHYVSTLIVSFPLGEARFRERFTDFEPLSQKELFEELYLFISQLDLQSTIFRSDHASNYLPLKGVLNKDKQRLLAELDLAIHHPDRMILRQEWQRGL